MVIDGFVLDREPIYKRLRLVVGELQLVRSGFPIHQLVIPHDANA